MLRNLNKDLKWLSDCQRSRDLSDDYLKNDMRNMTREDYQNSATELVYGITFVESTIAREWLERAIEAEKKFCI